MEKIKNILGLFEELMILRINQSGEILEEILNTCNVNLKNRKTIYQVFSEEEKYRVDRLLSFGFDSKKKYMEMDRKLGLDDYVDVEISKDKKDLYIYIRVFKSNRAKEVAYDRYVEKLINLTEIDPLTKVLNRYGFCERVKKIVQTGDPEKKLGFIFIDIDKLKMVNDEYGHKKGDEIISLVAKLLASSVRGRDIVTRFGGDEFIIVVEEPSGNKSAAKDLAQRLQKLISKDKEKFLTTISLGVHILKISTFLNSVNSDKDMYRICQKEIAKADKAVYMAKEQGRDQVAYTEDYLKYYAS